MFSTGKNNTYRELTRFVLNSTVTYVRRSGENYTTDTGRTIYIDISILVPYNRNSAHVEYESKVIPIIRGET